MKPYSLHSVPARGGFTLIQICVLLTVASLVLVAVLPSGKSASNSNTSSYKKLNAVFLALREYEAANGTLPCPADASQPIGSSNYGVAAANSGATNNCSGGTPAANFVDTTNHVAIGMVPVRTLQLSSDNALDGFGRDITYAVDTNATGCWASNSLSGQITVTDNGVPNSTVAALVSHGADGHGAWLPLTGTSGSAVRLNAGIGPTTDADQLTNAHVTANFTPMTVLTNFVNKANTSTFDDLVVYGNPSWKINHITTAYQANMQTPTVSGYPANNTYTYPYTLQFTLTFTTPVTVTGTPELSLSAIGTGNSIGTGNVAYAQYASGSGTTSLVFNYQIQSSDSAPLGITLANSITLNGGTITPCPLTFTPPNLSGVIIGGTVYVADTCNNRMQKCASSTGSCSIFSSSGAGNGQVSGPQAVAVDGSGNVWVADTTNNRVDEFNATGSPLNNYSGNNYFTSSFSSPSGIAIDSGGNIWVADTGNNVIKKCTSAGVCTSYGSAGSGNGQMNTPMGIAIDANNVVWVADYGNIRVDKFDNHGNPINSFSGGVNYFSESSAAGRARWQSISGISVDPSGNLWITDPQGETLQECTTAATPVCTVYGTTGSGNGQYQIPQQVAMDNAGNAWVIDSSERRGVVFTNSGTPALLFSSGTADYFGPSVVSPGNFCTPSGIAVNPPAVTPGR